MLRLEHAIKILPVSLLACLLTAQIGCGEDPTAPATSPTTDGADLRFAGIWNATVTIAGDDTESFSYFNTVTVSVSGSTISVSSLCVNGGGNLVMTGEGPSLRWAGEFECPAATTACPDGVMHFTYGQADITASGKPEMSFGGVLAGTCGTSGVTMHVVM